MSTAQSADTLWLVLASTLVISALISRRFSLRSALSMALAWLLIFGVALIVFSYRHEIIDIGHRVKTELTGQANQRAQGSSLHIKMALDGHYWVNGKIDGTPVKFLIDSGATVTALSQRVALDAGLDIDTIGPGMIMHTANGTVNAKRGSISELTIGPIQTQDLAIVVSESFGDVNVLGMNFLSRLRSWRVENGEMVLEP